MKGMVFTEFLEMVEEKFGFEIADNIVNPEELPSKGAYTAVGTYDHAELVTLIVNLHKQSNIPLGELQIAFGEYLFPRFHNNYSQLFDGIDGALDLLEQIEDHIHVEVRKLYPDAELPTFETTRETDKHLKMVYRSSRGMASFALGLIKGCADFYGDQLSIEMNDRSEGKASEVEFNIKKVA